MKSFIRRFKKFSLVFQKVRYLNLVLLALVLFLGGIAIGHTSFPEFVQNVRAAVASITGAGTISQVAAFNGTNTIGDSIMSQSGSTINVAGNISADSFSDANNPSYFIDPATSNHLKSLTINNGLTIHAGGIRDGSQGFLDVLSYISSPIFYDSDDSAYYVDPKGNSNLKNLQVQGSFGVSGTKNFVIDHPLKSGYQLVHASLEGPEAGVYYRGTARLSNGEIKITLPDYFDALTRDNEATVLLTAKGETPFLLSYDQFDKKSFVVHGTLPDGKFDWEVKSVRADIPALEVERKKNQ